MVEFEAQVITHLQDMSVRCRPEALSPRVGHERNGASTWRYRSVAVRWYGHQRPRRIWSGGTNVKRS